MGPWNNDRHFQHTNNKNVFNQSHMTDSQKYNIHNNRTTIRPWSELEALQVEVFPNNVQKDKILK